MIIYLLRRQRGFQRFVLACLMLLTGIQPLLHAHFNAQGLEDEPGFRLRLAGQTLQPEFVDVSSVSQDASAQQQEATVFVAPSLDLGDSADDWLLLSASALAAVVFYLLRHAQGLCTAAQPPRARWFCHWHGPPWRTGIGALSFASSFLPCPTAPPAANT